MPVAGLHRASPSTTLDKSYSNVKKRLIALASNISRKIKIVNKFSLLPNLIMLIMFPGKIPS